MKIQHCGSAKHQHVDGPGREGFQGCVGKQFDGGPSRYDSVEALMGMVRNSITIHSIKGEEGGGNGTRKTRYIRVRLGFRYTYIVMLVFNINMR